MRRTHRQSPRHPRAVGRQITFPLDDNQTHDKQYDHDERNKYRYGPRINLPALRSQMDTEAADRNRLRVVPFVEVECC